MLRRHLRLTPGVPLLFDLITTVLSFLLTFPIRSLIIKIYPFGDNVLLADYFPLLFPILVIWTILFNIQKSSVELRYPSFSNEIKRIVKTVIMGEIFLFMLLYSFRFYDLSRTLIWLFGIVNFIALLVERYCLLLCLEYFRTKGINRRSVLIIGDGEHSKRLVEYIETYSDWGLDIVGFLDGNGHEVGSEFYGSKILGRLEDLPEVLHNHFIEEVIFALPLSKLEKAKNLLQLCETEGVQTRIISDFYSGLVTYTEVETVHGLPIITYSTTPRNGWDLFFKRVIDIVISGVGLIILSPLLLIISVAIKLTSPGPIFYRWHVVGLNKKKFVSYKFRTMVVNADELKKKLMAKNEMNGVVFKMKNDPRITKVGRILRKFSLDELPQLYSVFKGDMSLVGPRPPLATEVLEFKNWHRRKLSVKPGITCLWQCSGRNHIEDFDDWVKMDLQYIDHWSLWLDFKILLKTIPAVLSGRGAY
ncbi:MAG: sugar transferase [bacterium]|nr:MAG: sugar transferase [bacterium]